LIGKTYESECAASLAGVSVAAPEQCPFLPPASASGGAVGEQAKDIELAKEMSFMSTNGTTLRKYGPYQAPERFVFRA
jgi:hypothetical protein